MKKSRMLFRILKMTHTDALLASFFMFFLLAAGAILLFEPTISRYGDALWYCFVSVTTIGFGDMVATTLFARIITVILTLYGIFIIALIPGVVVSYYMERLKLRTDESLLAFLDKIEHLPELSKEELTAMSQKAKDIRKKQHM